MNAKFKGNQALMQLFALLVTLALALITGSLTGRKVRCLFNEWIQGKGRKSLKTLSRFFSLLWLYLESSLQKIIETENTTSREQRMVSHDRDFTKQYSDWRKVSSGTEKGALKAKK